MPLVLIAVLFSAPPPPVRLSELIAEAKERNPELAAAREQARAAIASVGPAGALDDPMLMVQLWNAPVDLSFVPLMVQLTQQVPLGGKLAARRDAASAEAEAARANAEAVALDVEAAVGKAYFELYLADRTLDADAGIEEALRALISAAASRVASGKGEQSEALRAQAELLKIQSDREAVAARRASAVAKLIALLDRAPGSELGPTQEPRLLETLPAEAELRERALRGRPEVAGANAMISQAEARLRLTSAERVPDIGVFAAEMHAFRMPGTADFLFAGVQGNLPIWEGNKSGPKVEAATAQLRAARAMARALANRISAEVADAYAEVSAGRRQVELHHQLIPVARQALASATASYAAGKGSFLMVLDSERDLLMHQLDLAGDLAMYQQRLADLERAVGADLGLARASAAGHREEH